MQIKSLWLQNAREFGTFIGLIAIILIFSFWTPYFFTVSNLLNVAQQTTINAVIAVGMTYVIITAGIDLSVGSIMAFSGVVLASLLKADQPLIVAILGGLLVGTVSGSVNGVLISYGKLPPFISTLGLMSVARGAALLYTDGRPISGFEENFRFIATGEILHIPFPIIVMIIIYLIGHFVLTRTKLGRYTYATGGNEQAAILSGVNVKLIKIVVYSLCGLLSGAASVLLTARLNSAQPIAGIMYELDAIAAVVIGGTSLMGGEGKLTGTLIGALIMGVLRNGLNLLDVSSFIQQIVIGSVIISAVLIDMALKKKKA
ncbi:MAG: ribose ABC transporter permease [Melioribacteraceae bacterium]|nr:ribose ABC transporter permease [Melioribacteraceae bacterium]MCO6472244.1 ribose ABC transporter permease [Melioribacteraceae bacterium]